MYHIISTITQTPTTSDHLPTNHYNIEHPQISTTWTTHPERPTTSDHLPANLYNIDHLPTNHYNTGHPSTNPQTTNQALVVCWPTHKELITDIQQIEIERDVGGREIVKTNLR